MTTPTTDTANSELGFKLTKRESQCLLYIAQGKTARRIGSLLELSPRTVEIHTDNLKRKFRCDTKYELMEKAVEYGFIDIIPTTSLATMLGINASNSEAVAA